MKIIFIDDTVDYNHALISKLEPFLYSTPEDTIELPQFHAEVFRYFFNWHFHDICELIALGYRLIQEMAHIAEFLGSKAILNQIKYMYPFCLLIDFPFEKLQLSATCGSQLTLTNTGWITLTLRTKAPFNVKMDKYTELNVIGFQISGTIIKKPSKYDRENNFDINPRELPSWTKYLKPSTKITITIESPHIRVTVYGLNFSIQFNLIK